MAGSTLSTFRVGGIGFLAGVVTVLLAMAALVGKFRNRTSRQSHEIDFEEEMLGI